MDGLSFNLYDKVDLETVRRSTNPKDIKFDGRVDNDHRIDHILILQAKDQNYYVIENGIISVISVWANTIRPYIDYCKLHYAFSRCHYGAPDHSRGIPGVTNWNPQTEKSEPLPL